MKNELILILNEILIPLGFKKKGKDWIFVSNEINKIVNLQKSKYANNFYINYGFIINSLPLDGHLAHIFKGVGFVDDSTNNRLKELLNLENDISVEMRTEKLKEMLSPFFNDIKDVYSEADLRNQLVKQTNLNDVRLVVKKYFNLVQ